MTGLLVSASAAPAQVLKRELPALQPAGCPPAEASAPRRPDAADRAEAARLVAAGRNAAILDDHGSARELLARAAVLDPEAENIAYLLARTLEQLGDLDGALLEYCRYLGLAAGAPDADEVRDRVARLAPRTYEGGVLESAVDWFRAGLELYDRDRLPEAEQAFTATLREAPAWPAAYYNRAVVRAARQRPDSALLDLQNYLRLSPGAADRDAVIAWGAQLRNPPRTYSPGVAFTAGLLPGFGHFYTGRPVAGLLVLASAGGAVAFALAHEVNHVECRSIPVNDVCPPEDVNREWIERPYVAHAMGVALAATLLGAWDAARGARRRNAAVPSVRAGRAPDRGAQLSVLPPSLAASGERVRVDWVRLRF